MPKVFVVAGPAASGKSRFASKLAKHLQVEWLDFDDNIDELIGANSSEIALAGMEKFLENQREARYQDLISRAVVQLARGFDVVISAPFSKEVQDKQKWELRFEPLRKNGTETLYWISTKPEVRRDRMKARSSIRDVQKESGYDFKTIRPLVDFIEVDGEGNFDEIIRYIEK